MSFDSKIGKVVHGFRLKLDSVSTSEFNSWVRDTHKELNSWVLYFRGALGKTNPHSGQSKGITTPRTRLFPYMRTGELRDSVKVTRGKKTDIPTGKKYTIGVSIQDLPQYATNAGYGKPRADYPFTGKWVGWADDVFGTRRRGNVAGLKSVFNKLARRKKDL